MFSKYRMSKVNSEESSSSRKFLKEVETISEALYVNKNPRSSVAGPNNTSVKPLGRTQLAEPQKEKKSFWKWPLRALSHVRKPRFHCCFSAQVHSIDGLPPIFHDLYLTVHWESRGDESLSTRAVKVSNGRADFKDKLIRTCSVYGSRSGQHHSAEYGAKPFLLYASLVGSPEVDLGKHRMDPTRLLPLTLEELQDGKSSGKWSTTFQLTGKASGATLSMSFGYTVVGEEKVDRAAESQFEFDIVTKHIEANEHQSKEPLINKNGTGLPFEGRKKACEVPTTGTEEVVTGNLPAEEPLVNKNETDVSFEESKMAGELPVTRSEEVVGIITEDMLPEEGCNVSPKEEESIVPRDDEEAMKGERDLKEMIMKDLESALKSVEMLEATASEDEEDEENHGDAETCFRTPNKEATPSSSREFLDMLGIEHSPFGLSSESEPESPRERLLRGFEMETLAANSLFGFSIEADDPQMECDENFSKEYESDIDLTSLVHDIEEEYQLETQARVGHTRAKMLEDLETEILMREWGMSENTFQNSPPHNDCNAFSQADFPVKEPFDLPPLGDGLGPVVQTKNGGFLRSMSPLLFRNSKSGGSLIMQVSTPVVVPAAMGSGIVEILQRLATAGTEKLSMQANRVMPLDDISGKTMEEVLWESSPAIDGVDMGHRSEHKPDDEAAFVRRRASFAAKPKMHGSSSGNKNFDSEYVSLEDLAPLAMDQIEALSLEGLRIQSGMSDDDAPSYIPAQSTGEVSVFQGKSGFTGLEDDDDGLMGLSLTLDEWIKLDSGETGDEEEINERTSKILAAHHANPLNCIRKGLKGRKCGLLGNNFTVALMVQLRDPLRNYEPVGAPMLSLCQVERLFVPPKPIIYSTVSELRKLDGEEKESKGCEEVREEKTMEEQGAFQYKISEVHLTGMKSETDKKPCGVATQQQQVQSGSRWLLANGMGKGNKKLPLMKPKSASTKPGDKLWSVSGSRSKWKELGKMGKSNTHVRNPNVIMPK
ncbi:unnamed protein product [Microthlaspi erraticum]|uniref:C2 NT-type domain-containing protein n=1 Tax=Microthlaspi erraticum TaxID=1685480 RepID=A0A6D2IPZ8_9BRAS|nr:unnamed protein product [Microthlaspi erraticum]